MSNTKLSFLASSMCVFLFLCFHQLLSSLIGFLNSFEVCVSQIFHCFDQIPDRNNLREERFIFLIVSEISVHHGGEGMKEQFTRWQPGSKVQ
jgi:hypothetical protein